MRYLGVAINELNAWSLGFLHQALVDRQQELGQRAGGGNAVRDGQPDTAAAPASRTAQDDAEALLLTQIIPPLAAALELGLGHLSLDRAATTLSAGELQRLRLASQLHSSLFGVTYILDEPTAGLHPQERTAVLTVIRRLLAAGNNVFVVEHDMDFVAQADYLIDIGPYAGDGGGTVVFAGKPSELADANGQLAESPTAQALANRRLELADAPRDANGHLVLRGINHRNLQGLDLELGLGQFTAVAGVSGSGKSTLVTDVVGKRATEHPDISRVVTITQKPIGRTPRSTLATYTGMFDRVRSIFAAQARRDGKDAKKWNASKFSYNTKKGQCPECSGAGHIEVELVFLPGTYTLCPRCQGGRFNDEALEVRWHGRTVADVLQLRVTEALEVFRDLADGGSSSGSGTGSDGATGSTGSDGGSKDPDHSQITQVVRALEVLDELGLGYLRLGQGAPELSGGEAQRIKLATELQRTQKKSSLYLLDEPTMGLHPHDSAKLLDKLESLADAGATEQTNFATLNVRGKEVDNLDSSLQNLGFTLQRIEWWRIAVDSPLFAVAAQSWFVQTLTERIEDVSFDGIADGNSNWLTSVDNLSATDETVRRCQRNGPDQVIAEVLCNLKRDGLGDCLEGDLDSQRVIQSRHRSTRKFHVDDRTGDAHDAAGSVGATFLRVLLIESCSHDLVTFSAAGKRTSATDDLVDFLGNLCLTSLVSNARQVVDQLGRIIRRSFHGCTARGRLRSRCFQKHCVQNT